MFNKSEKKLTLKRESLRELTPTQLQHVAGGNVYQSTTSTFSAPLTPSTE